jgi:hypothetical protein
LPLRLYKKNNFPCIETSEMSHNQWLIWVHIKITRKILVVSPCIECRTKTGIP